MRVAETMEALLRSPNVDEVIAVNDGSTDRTLQILQRFAGRIGVVDLGENKSKGFAMAEGVRRARRDIALFVDAHLLNLQDSPLWPWTGQRAWPSLGG